MSSVLLCLLSLSVALSFGLLIPHCHRTNVSQPAQVGWLAGQKSHKLTSIMVNFPWSKAELLVLTIQKFSYKDLVRIFVSPLRKAFPNFKSMNEVFFLNDPTRFCIYFCSWLSVLLISISVSLIRLLTSPRQAWCYLLIYIPLSVDVNTWLINNEWIQVFSLEMFNLLNKCHKTLKSKTILSSQQFRT